MKIWDSEQLWLKAKTYAERANEVSHGNPDFPMRSALSLELLARAALTRVHPVLNADPRDDVSIMYACGFPVPGQPKSIPAHSVYLRLEKIVPGFSKAQREVCDFLALLRNQELHTSELAFSNLKESKWLPRYYEVCRLLCGFMGKPLEAFLGLEIAKTADALIATLARQTETAVKRRIADQAKSFSQKKPAARKQLVFEATIALKTTSPGTTKEACPSCRTEGILSGSLIKELSPEYMHDRLYIDQEFLANQFECLACGLRLQDVEEIAAAGLEPRFADHRETNLHELYQPEMMYEYDNM
ncbi:MAG: hypothetical protein ABTQ25_14820 [Nitrosomonas ureae]